MIGELNIGEQNGIVEANNILIMIKYLKMRVIGVYAFISKQHGVRRNQYLKNY